MKKRTWNATLTIISFLLLSLPGLGCEGEAGAPENLARIKARATEVKEDLIRIRREIHMNPEISGMEEKTAALIAEHLRGTLRQIDIDLGDTGYGFQGAFN